MTILDDVTETAGTEPSAATRAAIEVEARHTAHNYSPLPVVAASAEAPGSPTSTAADTWTVWPRIPR